MGLAACGILGMGLTERSRAYAETAYEQTAVPMAAKSGDVAQPLSVCNPQTPEVIRQPNGKYYQSYNCFTLYTIKNLDQHAKQIWMGHNNGDFGALKYYNVGYGDTVGYVTLPSYGSTTCHPFYYNVSAYCEECKTRSLSNGVMIGDYSNGYDGYALKGCTNYKIDGTIPTDLDEDGSIWAHGGGDIIYFSIAYKGQAKDGQVTIPWLGTRSVDIPIGGVTFTVRTGPNKVSVKASTNIQCNEYDTIFAFKTVTE